MCFLRSRRSRPSRRVLIPPRGQVSPLWIEARDQPKLFLSTPSLELFLSSDGSIHVVEALSVHKTNRIVIVGESLEAVRFMLKDAAVKIVGHSNVERAAGTALEDVDVETIFAAHASIVPCRALRTLWL